MTSTWHSLDLEALEFGTTALCRQKLKFTMPTQSTLCDVKQRLGASMSIFECSGGVNDDKAAILYPKPRSCTMLETFAPFLTLAIVGRPTELRVRRWSDRGTALVGGPVKLRASTGSPAERRALVGGPTKCRASDGGPAKCRASSGGPVEHRASGGDPAERQASGSLFKRSGGSIYRFPRVAWLVNRWEIKGKWGVRSRADYCVGRGCLQPTRASGKREAVKRRPAARQWRRRRRLTRGWRRLRRRSGRGEALAGRADGECSGRDLNAEALNGTKLCNFFMEAAVLLSQHLAASLQELAVYLHLLELRPASNSAVIFFVN
ncbi:hypothetical protein M5K25_020634 [Dendrobium thyrsiflorum]|uniref:Uncharacterized protein n=1 Tax=Dendrobium thyrsiflorum TaxID=117978 RepID=A0ABD0UAJ5_DENTH